ncbi:MAG: UvrD-helicase domain-containing protein [Magnetococcus sp. DMHC-6]
MQPEDYQDRQRALDPRGSFIVQAPAGSGKTGLLTQRFLRLLSGVTHPEEVVAITFTRKAATEMANRILEAMTRAFEGDPPPSQEGHEYQTWALARAALQRDSQYGWGLLRHPGRLRILTIDALCHTITGLMPVLSGLGGRGQVTDDARALYQLAARQTLAQVSAENRWSDPVAHLLDHLDNNHMLVEEMLAALLANRDQWLRHLFGAMKEGDAREILERALLAVRREALENLPDFSPGFLHELAPILAFAAGNLMASGQNGEGLLGWKRGAALDAVPEEISLAMWLQVAQLCLTLEGTWRRVLNKNQGFPPGTAARNSKEKELFNRMKASLLNLFDKMQPYESFRMWLHRLRLLPPESYEEEQWQLLQALLTLLPMAVAQLRMVFSAQGVMDHVEVTLRALHALGDSDCPSDIALKLDYRIQHLLVDEFQDTSVTHYQLLERLTAGWTGEDGRTLFLVGDPMQSIYRFREADVGLFLKARRHGIGAVRVEPLHLSVNFRSQTGIVAWVNRAFALTFPHEEEVESGAVPYSQSVAFKGGEGVVRVHPFLGASARRESDRVVEICREALLARPEGEIAILVRSRRHLQEILPALSAAGLRYQAVEIDPLSERSVVKDLWALLWALLDPADRVHWLALLRAPWCGLTLEDLSILVGDAWERSVWDLMQEESRLVALSAEGEKAVRRVRQILTLAFAARRRGQFGGGLRLWLEGVWLALGGPAVVTESTGLTDADRFLELLEQEERAGEVQDPEGFAKRVEALFAAVDPQADGHLQVMTIHKAKGLEFDTVILPGIGNGSPPERSRLLTWLERSGSTFGEGLILAPVKAADRLETDPIQKYLREIEHQRAEHESLRLMYVATTRAKHFLHILGHVPRSSAISKETPKEEDFKPRFGSLLSLLWPAVEDVFAQVSPIPEEEMDVQEGDRPEVVLSRLTSGQLLCRAGSI